MMTQNKPVPALRFPEFNDEWEEQKLGNVVKISSGGTPSRGNPNYWGGAYSWVTTSLIDFYTIYQTEEYITDLGLKNSSAKLFPVGTILMAMYGQGKTRGKVGLLGIEATTNQACAAIISNKEKLNQLYLFQNLAGRYDEIRNLSNSGGQENLSAELIKSIPITFPSLPEQLKIAAFLTAVDKKIHQLTKKKDLLEQYKKGVMQKIFNQEIRFKDDNGDDFADWEERELGSFLIPTLREVNKPNEQYLAIGVRSHCKGTFQKPNSEPEKVAMDKLYVVRENDLIVNITFAWEGAIAIVKKEDDGGLVSHRFPTYTFNRKISSHHFFQYVFTQKKFRLTLDLISPGGAGRNRVLSKKDFLKVRVGLPSVPEQKKIVNFLSAIDEKINLVNQHLEKTQTFKKGLLQQMFV
jgi:type I restriction enzyme S subunit